MHTYCVSSQQYKILLKVMFPITAVRDIIPQLITRRVRHPSRQPRVRFVYRDHGAASRYRVFHQVEQAHIMGLGADVVSLDDLEHLYELRDCDLLYLYRLPLTSRSWPLLTAARLLKVPILFDSDDLVWDVRVHTYNYLDQHYSADTVDRILLETRRIYHLMQRTGGFVFATPYLGQIAAKTFKQPSWVNANALSMSQVAAAEAAYLQRTMHKDHTIIGYFCGTPHVHDEDLANIGAALAAVLQECPEVRLRFYGKVSLPMPLTNPAFTERIEQLPAVGWDELPTHIAQVDINIAPLVDNPQRRAKSAVKYFEAALLRIPTIAARLEPFTDVIDDGTTGLLAGTEDEWVTGLLKLVRSSKIRQVLGTEAYKQTRTWHTTQARAPGFASIVNAVIGRYTGILR